MSAQPMKVESFNKNKNDMMFACQKHHKKTQKKEGAKKNK